MFIFGIAISLGMCLFSRIAIGTGCVICLPADVLLFRQLCMGLKETINTAKENDKQKKDLRRLRGPVIITLSVLILSEACFSFYSRLFQTPESVAKEQNDVFDVSMVELERGPLRGLHSFPVFRTLYDGVLEDMDLLMEKKPHTLFTMAYCGWPNLYTNLPYGACNLYSFADDLSQTVLLSFWENRPNKIPDAVYIPFFDGDVYGFEPEAAAKKLEYIKAHCDCTVQTGKCGYIIHISGWHEPLTGSRTFS